MHKFWVCDAHVEWAFIATVVIHAILTPICLLTEAMK